MKACEISLKAFVRAAWHVIEPGSEFVDGWHIDVICDELEAITTGRINREIFNVPPRMGKSNLVEVFWPAWEWIQRPSGRWIFVSYSADVSTPLSMKRRNLITSDWYQERWGERVKIAADQNMKTEFENTARGVMFSTSVGGTVTGRGGSRIVIDDPHNPKQALSDLQRQAAIDFFKYTLSTRLDNPKTGAMVLIMQRLHEEDLTGYLLKEHPGVWKHIKMPMVASEKEIIRTAQGNTYVRNPGDYLQPERFPPDAVAALRKDLGSYGASGQLDQRPSPAEGGIWKRHWWRHWAEGTLPKDFDLVLQSWDCAFKDKEDSDFVVGQVWGKKDANFYLLDEVRDRMSFTATCKAILSLSAKWPEAVTKLIEDKANGPAVIDALRSTVSGLIPIEPRGSKSARAEAVSPVIEASNVYLPPRLMYAWVDEFIDECANFPKAKNDDRVDAASQALDRFITMTGGVWQLYVEGARELEEKRKAESADKPAA